MGGFTSQGDFHRAYATQWMARMCAHAGVPAPSDDAAMATFRELSVYVAERANSEIAGAANAVRSLHRAGYTLRAASGTTSWELRAITAKMGVAKAFSGFCGPDLVDHVKHGPAFYEKVFAHAGVRPGEALVIESDEVCCSWASEAGAQAIWVDGDGSGDVTTLAALVDMLA